MNPNIIFMYSGQGSQYKNMGRELYQLDPVFKYWMDRLDKYFIGFTKSSFFDRFYGESASTELIHTHLAIFMVEYAMTQVLLSQEIYPDAVIGVSLGEFTSSAVNERIDPLACMELIFHQADMITRFCPKGRLLSILTDFSIYEEQTELYENSELVSLNFKNNFTIAVREEEVENITVFLNQRKLSYVPLTVEYGFHSSLIDKGEKSFLDYLHSNEKRFSKTLDTPYAQYSSALAESLKDVPADFFWEVVRRPIDFQNTVVKAIKANSPNFMVDLGPSGTLATSVRYLLKEENVRPYTILTPYGGAVKNLEALYQALDN